MCSFVSLLGLLIHCRCCCGNEVAQAVKLRSLQFFCLFLSCYL